MDIKFEDIQKANETIRTMTIERKDKNGKVTSKEYAEVNQRIKAFRIVYPTGSITTEMIKNEDGICIFKAFVGYTEDDKEIVLGTGTASEIEGSSFINNTSYIENCETSAVGRALGMAGFGIDTSVASFEEVANAIQHQEEEKLISKTQVDALYELIKNRAVENDHVMAVLAELGYHKLSEIKIKDYMGIVNQFNNFRRD